MSKRLQVVMDDAEYADLEAAAREQGETVSQWVRKTLRRSRLEQPQADQARKLAAIRATRNLNYPTGDIGQLLAETERRVLTFDQNFDRFTDLERLH